MGHTRSRQGPTPATAIGASTRRVCPARGPSTTRRSAGSLRRQGPHHMDQKQTRCSSMPRTRKRTRVVGTAQRPGVEEVRLRIGPHASCLASRQYLPGKGDTRRGRPCRQPSWTTAAIGHGLPGLQAKSTPTTTRSRSPGPARRCLPRRPRQKPRAEGRGRRPAAEAEEGPVHPKERQVRTARAATGPAPAGDDQARRARGRGRRRSQSRRPPRRAGCHEPAPGPHALDGEPSHADTEPTQSRPRTPHGAYP